MTEISYYYRCSEGIVRKEEFGSGLCGDCPMLNICRVRHTATWKPSTRDEYIAGTKKIIDSYRVRAVRLESKLKEEEGV